MEHTNRRLAAILAADVVGYSRLMAADEAGTLSALKTHREQVFNPAVARHKGRVFKLIGDGTLVEFGSVVDAVNCAIAIQNAARGTGGITLRIGVNLGDVIPDGDDVYGDGVNVAARLEPLSVPGGICVSAIVNESVRSRVDCVFEDGGEVYLKNIDHPVRVWRWHPDAAAATVEPQRTASADTRPRQDDRPSIAVLPFDNMSGDPEQEYFSDGITEDIITDLSKVAGILVIARNSSFAYKRKSVDIRSVARELEATSVLEGSIRRAGERVRITAQLIDAVTGTHLWAERYDRDLTDIFAVQDDVTQRIVEALKVTLTPGEMARISVAPTTNMQAHDLFLRGREALLGVSKTRETFQEAVARFTQAVELDPDFAAAYAGLAHAYNHDFQNRWSGRSDSKELSEHYSRIALEKGPDDPYVRYMAGLARFWQRDLSGSEDEIGKSLDLSPSFALAMAARGLVRIYRGAPLEAISDLENAIRLDPALRHQYLHFIGSAHLVASHYAEAVDAFRERIRLVPDTDLSRGLMISALGHLGRVDDAQEVRAELKRLKPGYSFEDHVARLPFTDPADTDRLRAGWAKADVGD